MSADDTSRGPGARWQGDVLETVGALLADVSGVSQKTMFGVPAFFVDGRLFCCVWGDGVGLRMPLELAQTFVGADALGPFKPFGRAPMGGWVFRGGIADGSRDVDGPLILGVCEHVRTL